jgi:hypothetical protein
MQSAKTLHDVSYEDLFSAWTGDPEEEEEFSNERLQLMIESSLEGPKSVVSSSSSSQKSACNTPFPVVNLDLRYLQGIVTAACQEFPDWPDFPQPLTIFRGAQFLVAAQTLLSRMQHMTTNNTAAAVAVPRIAICSRSIWKNLCEVKTVQPAVACVLDALFSILGLDICVKTCSPQSLVCRGTQSSKCMIDRTLSRKKDCSSPKTVTALGGCEVKVTDDDVVKASGNQSMWYLEAFVNAQLAVIPFSNATPRVVITTNLFLWSFNVWIPRGSERKMRVLQQTTSDPVQIVSTLWHIDKLISHVEKIK